jgi:hypothetical protein
MTFSCHLLFQSVATVTTQGGKREGSLSDISQPWTGTVWFLSATDGAVHCCLTCHNTYVTRTRVQKDFPSSPNAVL